MKNLSFKEQMELNDHNNEDPRGSTRMLGGVLIAAIIFYSAIAITTWLG